MIYLKSVYYHIIILSHYPMNSKIIFALLFCLIFPMAALAQHTTLKQEMNWLHQNRKVNFVYDAKLNVNQAYTGPTIRKMQLGQALATLFANSGISYEQKGNHVMLRKASSTSTATPAKTVDKPRGKPQRTHTLSGYVKDLDGETLINATVYDLTTRQGTLTNAYGFFSITLPEGEHDLRCSYIGFEDKLEKLHLDADRHITISMKENARVGEVVVVGDLNSPLINTQTGKRSLSSRDIQTEFAMLSSPDVVKTLQRISGVAEGVELASGLYVHGGNNDENLFLIDGTPLYQINHTMGLFSAFNTDVVKNVDFYKSGFPARYGGRLSSVVDVRTNDGDFYHAHGSYRIGLLDGSVHFEGPIRKGKTSYNIGLRRSWLDILSRPAFAIANRGNKEDKISINYFFHDLNAKVTNIFNDRSRMSLSLYSGQDQLKTKDEWKSDWDDDSSNHDITKNNFSWGNLNAALNWNYQFSPKLFANFTAVYTYNKAKLHTIEDDRSLWGGKETKVYHTEHKYQSTINDLGYRSAFDYRPSPHHHIRFGHDYTWHTFKPQTRMQNNYSSSHEKRDTFRTSGSNRHTAHEWNVYAEDEMTLNNHWSVNGGVNATMFNIGSKTFGTLDPRFAVKYQPTGQLSFKASYTMMTQFVHKISNAVLELPTDYWVPTTERLKPMRSWQVAGGVYYQPARHWMLSMEGYYKYSRHLLQYTSWSSLEPPAEKWDLFVMDGKGRFYGMEVDASYTTKRLELQGAYTLSWNQRKYDDFYSDWYFDKFDNRHKLNLSARWKITDKISAFGVWSFHSGNHITVPTQLIATPNTPGGHPVDYDDFQSHVRQGKTYDPWEERRSYEDQTVFVYDKPNNMNLPAYHRLDIGFDFHHTTKHGHERIWNLSFYNVYCHFNSLFVEVKQRKDGKFYIKNHAYIPVVPSFSYTIKF